MEFSERVDIKNICIFWNRPSMTGVTMTFRCKKIGKIGGNRETPRIQTGLKVYSINSCSNTFWVLIMGYKIVSRYAPSSDTLRTSPLIQTILYMFRVCRNHKILWKSFFGIISEYFVSGSVYRIGQLTIHTLCAKFRWPVHKLIRKYRKKIVKKYFFLTFEICLSLWVSNGFR